MMKIALILYFFCTVALGQAVKLVRSSDGTGYCSGSVVSGMILTAKHCVCELKGTDCVSYYKSILVQFPDGHRASFSIKKMGEGAEVLSKEDWAFLEGPVGAESFKLGKKQTKGVGTVIAAKRDKDEQLYKVMLSSSRDSWGLYRVLGNILKGDSGAPVLNDNDEVIGIVSGYEGTGQGLIVGVEDIKSP
jgi:V8-like Glu-specific endopeptidase